jgi:hypothetical protein
MCAAPDQGRRKRRAQRIVALLMAASGVVWVPATASHTRSAAAAQTLRGQRIVPRAVRPWKGLALQPSASLATAGQVSALRADGRLVVADAAPTSTTCEELVVWNPSTGHSISPISHVECPDRPHDGSNEGLMAIALAGQQLSWISARVSSYSDGSLLFGNAPVDGHPVLAEPSHPDEGNPQFDPSLASFDLDGSGSITTRTRSDSCINLEDTLIINSKERCHAQTWVFLRSGHHWRWLWGASVLADVVNVDAGRVAVQRNGQLAILAPSGAVLDDVSIPRGGGVQARLTGDRVVVLAGRSRTLHVYTTTGTEIAAWRVPSTRPPVLNDARGDLAAYADGPRLHLVDFTGGRHTVIRMPGTGPVNAQLEAPGLVYSYARTSSPEGALEFVTSVALRHLLRERR